MSFSGWVLKKKGTHIKYINVMYERATTSMKTLVGDTKEFPIIMGLLQGSTLRPYLFTLIMDELTNIMQNKVP